MPKKQCLQISVITRIKVNASLNLHSEMPANMDYFFFFWIKELNPKRPNPSLCTVWSVHENILTVNKEQKILRGAGTQKP